MFDVEQIRKDFPMLNGRMMHEHPLIYLDNGATTLKPQSVIDAVCRYLSSYSGNAHRGDYDLSHEVDEQFEAARKTIAEFIHAKRPEEIVFTSGSTDSLNMIAYGYGRTHLKEGDEILLTVAEHASNTLPWFDVAQEVGAVVNYIELDAMGRLTLENVQKAITDQTKVIAVAEVTNVLGFHAPMKDICQYVHERGIIVVVDGAQSVPHQVTDVQESDIDFLAFSGHKMCGPTGIGVMYGKYDLLCETKPTRLGGGSNSRYNSCGVVTLKNPPYKFEAGTPNIEGAIGLGKAVEYLKAIGMENIHAYEKELRDYCLKKMQQLDNVEIYNAQSHGAIAFNIKGVFSQDAASLFNTYGIAVRAGQHCAKILDEFLNVSTTLRASFYFYNTKEEIDQFIEVCKKGDDFLDAFFG
ncbi:aminotransferase class V-fold PLP-dependent enzyme [Candidatus Stoquefichus sp. SB1]|uniref:aminotransferase class V-fold PLP-dependent enzyme n=1 Tax=Candidatus Stoquefichus sp. SB1 TaxID=1658109 RepID=UPI00067EE214|nr:SufS family cysteine desulfurase [Candidatus Stoquefichus sp. SB1]